MVDPPSILTISPFKIAAFTTFFHLHTPGRIACFLIRFEYASFPGSNEFTQISEAVPDSYHVVSLQTRTSILPSLLISQIEHVARYFFSRLPSDVQLKRFPSDDFVHIIF